MTAALALFPFWARAHQGLLNARARRSLLAVVINKPPAVQLLWEAIML